MQKRIVDFLKQHKTLIYSLVISLILGLISCFVIHKEEYDLTVYKQMINIMKTLDAKDLINYICHRGEIISMVYFYLMGLIGLECFIQVLPTFIFYFIMFYIIIDYSLIKNYKKKNILIVAILFLGLFKYMNIATCIRNNLAFSVFLLGFYFENFKKKKKSGYAMYIISCFIHTSLWAVFILKALLKIKNKKIVIGVMVIILLFIAFPQILIYLCNISNIEFLEVIAGRLEMYILDAKMYFNIQYLFRIMQFIALTIFSIYSLYKYNSKEEKMFKDFSVAVFVITLCLISKYWIFLRFVDFSLFIALIPVITLLEKEPNNILKKMVYLGIFLMIIVGIRIQIPTFTQMFIK